MIGRVRAVRLGLALLLVLAVAGMFYALVDDEPPAEVATARPSATTATAAVPSDPPTTQAAASAEPGLTDGIYAVGSEIRPGVYSTTAGERACYWARLRSFGQRDSIIEDRNVEPGAHARVVVKATDRGFKVSNGCTWHQAL